MAEFKLEEPEAPPPPAQPVRYKRPAPFDEELAATAGLCVYGSTYAVKDELKALGCRFHSTKRVWVARSPEMLIEADRIVARGPLDPAGEPMLEPVTIVRALNAAAPGLLLAAIRRRGITLVPEAAATLADAVAGWPPTIDDLDAEAFDFGEDAIRAAARKEGRNGT